MDPNTGGLGSRAVQATSPAKARHAIGYVEPGESGCVHARAQMPVTVCRGLSAYQMSRPASGKSVLRVCFDDRPTQEGIISGSMPEFRGRLIAIADGNVLVNAKSLTRTL